jgi:hypothetical protein
MQKQGYVSDKRIRDVGAQENFDIRPQNLYAQPDAATQRHECPEKPGTCFRCPYIAQHGEQDEQEKKTLGKVAKSGQAVTVWNRESQDALDRHQPSRENPTLLP